MLYSGLPIIERRLVISPHNDKWQKNLYNPIIRTVNESDIVHGMRKPPYQQLAQIIQLKLEIQVQHQRKLQD